MRTFSFAVLAGALLATTATAQRLIAHDPFGGFMAELQPPAAVLFAPNPPLIGYPTAPALPPPAFGVPAPGDSTFDNVVGLSWYTDGMMLASMPSPTYPPAGPVFPPLPIPAGVLGAIGGPVTAIALDPVAGIMYLSSMPGIVIGVAPVPGMPVMVPPFPIGLPLGPIAGLEWDGITGSLWAVDIGSVAGNFFPGGAPAGPMVAPAFAMPGPAGDIAIDKMGTINPAGLRPLYVTAGGMVVDINDPGAPMFPSGPPAEGLAFMNAPAEVPPMGGCATCPIMPGPFNFTTGPMTSGNGAFAVGVTGVTPLSIVVHAFDIAFAPAFPLINPSGCPFGLAVSPGLITAVGITDAAGTAVLPLPLTVVPVGVTLYNQTLAFCPPDPTGFVFSPFQVIQVGGL